VKGDSLRTRARHWTRWRTNRARRTWRHASHVDLLTNEARSAWLCSWQRSGSTWAASILASAPGTRLIYEPANLPGSLFTGEAAASTPLPTSPGPELAAIERALRGRVRGAWVDQLASGHVVHRRVVKDVRGIGLLGLTAARHPTAPIVVLVRHPLSIARSVVALGWVPPEQDPDDEAMLREVRRWVALHADALRSPLASRALVVTYEHLVLSPDEVLPRILAHLGSYHHTWRGLEIDREVLTAPSATSFLRDGSRSAQEWIGSFDRIADHVIEQSAAILADAGFDALYSTSNEPRVGPDDVAAAIRRR
jgi:hypothetical protein